jgi:hypothetical protein
MERAELRLECLKLASSRLPQLGEKLIAEAKLLEDWVLEAKQSVRGPVKKPKPRAKKASDNSDILS